MSPRRRRGRLAGSAHAHTKIAGFILAVLLAALGVESPAFASGGATTTFKFSGALSGTLRIVPNVDCGGTSGGEIQLDDVAGHLKGDRATRWTILIFAAHNGTFKIKNVTLGPGTKLTVEANGGRGLPGTWAATSGTVTVDGTRGSAKSIVLKGSANPGGAGASETVHLQGSWNCPT